LEEWVAVADRYVSGAAIRVDCCRLPIDGTNWSEVCMAKKALSTLDDGRAIHSAPSRDLDLDHVRTAIEGIRFGEVRVIIQDGVIVQIERVEKQRLR
jgi:hypothetical protein